MKQLLAKITAEILLIATLSSLPGLFTPSRAVAADYASIALKRGKRLLDIANEAGKAGSRNLFCENVEKANAWFRVATIEIEIDHKALQTLDDIYARANPKENSASGAAILQQLKENAEVARSLYLSTKDLVSTCGTNQ